MSVSWDWQLLGCYERGARAFFDGKPEDACPYVGHRGLNRQRADYWRDGYRSAKAGKFLDDRRALRDCSI
jgi:ribosome modulation factor